MFPIRDEFGNVLGFGGRSLKDILPAAPATTAVAAKTPLANHPNEAVAKKPFKDAKYMNCADSDIFKKGELWYGLDLARPSITASRTAVVVEGYMDVVSSAQLGINNVVGSLGTGVSLKQLMSLAHVGRGIQRASVTDDLVDEVGKGKLPASSSNRVVLLMDADSAGEEASMRVCKLLRKEAVKDSGDYVSDLDLRVASLGSLPHLIKNFSCTGVEPNDNLNLLLSNNIKDVSDLLMLCGNKDIGRKLLTAVVETAVDWKIYITEKVLDRLIGDYKVSTEDGTVNLMLEKSNTLR
jgi:5S rRNA maturation endonuclease (ribonuclease M5)